VHGSAGRPRHKAFTRAPPGSCSHWGMEMDPTIHQIIFSCIIMLTRKVAADLCLLFQSLSYIFICTTCSHILWACIRNWIGREQMITSELVVNRSRVWAENKSNIVIFAFFLERKKTRGNGNAVLIWMGLLVFRSYLSAAGHLVLVRAEDSCKQNSSKK
jgi:Ni,Fe-hydrogenase I cytochrome b subunit